MEAAITKSTSNSYFEFSLESLCRALLEFAHCCGMHVSVCRLHCATLRDSEGTQTRTWQVAGSDFHTWIWKLVYLFPCLSCRMFCSSVAGGLPMASL